MQNFIIFFVIYLILFSLTEWIVRRKLNIKKKQKFGRSYINKSHKIGTVVIYSVAIVSGIIVAIALKNTSLVYYFFWVGLFVQAAFTAYMQYKYDKASKEYIISIIEIIFVGIGFVGLLILLPYVTPFCMIS